MDETNSTGGSSSSSEAPPTCWVTWVSEDPCVPVPQVGDDALCRLFEVPNGRAPHGPLLLAKVKQCPRGYTPRLGDIEELYGIAFDVHNFDPVSGFASPLIEHPDKIREALPFEILAYTTMEHTVDHTRAIAVLPFARGYSLRDAYRIREYVRERVWTSPVVDPVEFDAPLLPPQMSGGLVMEGLAWCVHHAGPKIAVEDVPQDFTPSTPFTEPFATDEDKRKVRRERAERAFAQLPVLLDLFRRSDLHVWLKANPVILMGLVRQVASNLAPLVRATRAAGRERFAAAREQVEAVMREMCDEEPRDWAGIVEDVLTAELEQVFDAAACWPEFYGRHVPDSIGGLTSTPLDDIRRLAERENLDPRRWLFVATLGQWFPMKRDGRFDPEGMSQAAVVSLLRGHLSAGSRDEDIKRFLDSAIRVHKRDAVFSSPLEITQQDGLWVQNLYRPTTLKPRRGEYPNILRMIRNIAGPERTEEAVEFILDWIAGVVQGLKRGKPHKWLTYLIFQGVPGSGKGKFTEVLSVLIGSENVVVTDQARLESTYFPVRRNTILLVGNEIHASDRGEQDLANHLKRIVTDPTLMVERKFEPAGEVPNNLNLIVTTNNEKAVKLDRDDRRGNVFASTERLPADVAAAIDADLKGARREASALFYDLLQRNVQIGIDELFQTKARRDLIALGQSRLEAFMDLLKSDGYLAAWDPYFQQEHNAQPATVKVKDQDGIEREHILSDTLLAVARFHCPATRGKDLTAKILSAALEKALPSAKSGARIRAGRGGNPVRAWTGIPLVVNERGKVERVSGDPAVPEAAARQGEHSAVVRR